MNALLTNKTSKSPSHQMGGCPQKQSFSYHRAVMRLSVSYEGGMPCPHEYDYLQPIMSISKNKGHHQSTHEGQ